MSLRHVISNQKAYIKISGDFTYSDSQNYRTALQCILQSDVTSIEIDLADTTYMDSSGLGMLLLTHSECKPRNIELMASHPQTNVKLVLEMTKCHERFPIID